MTEEYYQAIVLWLNQGRAKCDLSSVPTGFQRKIHLPKKVISNYDLKKGDQFRLNPEYTKPIKIEDISQIRRLEEIEAEIRTKVENWDPSELARLTEDIK